MDMFPEINIFVLRDRMSQMQFPDPICGLCASDSIGLINVIEGTLKNIGVSDSPFEQGVE